MRILEVLMSSFSSVFSCTKWHIWVFSPHIFNGSDKRLDNRGWKLFETLPSYL